ncbi:hypothetical protein AB0932_30100 [Streptomyces sp. NPDC006682]|uniref:hypothetical protein n=1 Tax=unclassified Streptomyces TaxID=2593676 RepID=UPI0034568A77
MSQADERNRLEAEFHGLAGHINRLITTSPDQTTLDRVRLIRWQSLYETEAAEVVRRRDSILRDGGVPQKIPSSAELTEWNIHARKILEGAPDEPSAS